MARLDYVEYDDTSGELRELYDLLRGSNAKPMNLHRLMGNSPELLKRYRGLIYYLREESVLERKLRELVILTVAAVTDTPYERLHHAHLALTAGASKEQVEAAGKDFTVFDQKYGAALRYAAEVAASGRVKDDTFAELRRYFDAKEIVELTILAGAYVMISRYLTALQVDIEPELAGE